MSRAKVPLGLLWLIFASVNTYLTFALPGDETIPYHLIWGSFALLYGLYSWSKWLTWTTFWGITVITGIALIEHAVSHIIGVSECSEIVLMGVILALLVWHVDRHRAMQHRLVVMQDDERRRAQSREMATRFGSHEARTRLTIVRGFVELMAAATDDDGIRADAELVLDELDKASRLVTNLLTLVTVSEVSQRSPVDTDYVIQAVLRRWIATADRDWSSSISTGVVWADAERLEAALDCLLENSVKFTKEGDSISVEGSFDGSTLLISVRDTGLGIPPADLEHIFEIFHTSSSAGDRAGNGLGLAIVHAIVEARRGSVEVESTEGFGTCITLKMRTSPAGQHLSSPRGLAEHDPPTPLADRHRPRSSEAFPART